MKIKDINLEFLGHSGFLIEYQDKVIVIDPFNISENIKKADLVLITHSHYDHCSIKDLEKISKKGTIILSPPDAQSKINKLKDVEMQIIELKDELEFFDFKIKTFPSYNLGKEFHPKSEGWLGFIIKIDKVTVYHAGDSDLIPEMEKLTGHSKHDNFFIALLPVSGTYVMDSEEAAKAASLIKPDLAIPMHYGSIIGTLEDAERFVKLCEKSNISSKILDKI